MRFNTKIFIFTNTVFRGYAQNVPVLTVSSVGINNNNQRFRCLLTVWDYKTVTTVVAIRIAVGIADTVMDGAGIVVYPNPGGHTIRIRLGDRMEMHHLEIVDMTGRVFSILWK